MVSLRKYLRDLGCNTYRTGSSVICDPPVLDTDIDVLVYQQAMPISRLGDLLVHHFGATECHKVYQQSEFLSLRLGKVNLLLCKDESYYKAKCLATDYAKRLNLLDKAERVQFFEVVTAGRSKINDIFDGISDDPAAIPTIAPW